MRLPESSLTFFIHPLQSFTFSMATVIHRPSILSHLAYTFALTQTEGLNLTKLIWVISGQSTAALREVNVFERSDLKDWWSRNSCPSPFSQSRLVLQHSISGGKLKLNCMPICIIVHINEAMLYEYSYFLFCCLIKKRSRKGGGGGLESWQDQQ